MHSANISSLQAMDRKGGICGACIRKTAKYSKIRQIPGVAEPALGVVGAELVTAERK
jgi:hypothetical protein